MITKELAPHQQRVVTEKKELDEKIERLEPFINTPGSAFGGLTLYERGRLLAQLRIMQAYSQILSDRIAAF